MKIFAKILFILIPIVICLSCDEGTSPEELSGMYLYKGFDSLNTHIVEGWLQLNFVDSIRVTGSWHLEQKNKAEGIGPQIGQGELTGGYKDGRVMLDLQPGMMDNNVYLDGVISNKRYEGEWTYSSFIGVTNYGAFVATKIK